MDLNLRTKKIKKNCVGIISKILFPIIKFKNTNGLENCLWYLLGNWDLSSGMKHFTFMKNKPSSIYSIYAVHTLENRTEPHQIFTDILRNFRTRNGDHGQKIN